MLKYVIATLAVFAAANSSFAAGGETGKDHAKKEDHAGKDHGKGHEAGKDHAKKEGHEEGHKKEGQAGHKGK